MPTNQIRVVLKYVRKFFAGFVSVTPFAKTKLSGYPFARSSFALDQDWLDIGSDIETATNKTKK